MQSFLHQSICRHCLWQNKIHKKLKAQQVFVLGSGEYKLIYSDSTVSV